MITAKSLIESDAVDTVTLDVPLLIRLLEYSREEIKTDEDLHALATRVVQASKNGPLGMKDWEAVSAGNSRVSRVTVTAETVRLTGPFVDRSDDDGSSAVFDVLLTVEEDLSGELERIKDIPYMNADEVEAMVVGNGKRFVQLFGGDLTLSAKTAQDARIARNIFNDLAYLSTGRDVVFD